MRRPTLTTKVRPQTLTAYRNLALIARLAGLSGDEFVREALSAVSPRVYRLAASKGVDVDYVLARDEPVDQPTRHVYDH